MRKNKKRLTRTLRKSYSIIGDGYTEKWYFELMKQHEHLPRIDLKPELPRKQNLRNLFNQAIDNAKDYDKVFLLFDFDTIINNNQIEKFKRYLRKIARINKIIVLINNPCLEFWFLLHFEKTSKYFSHCSGVESELKKKGRIESYQKTEKFFKYSQKDIYALLKPLQNNVLQNASCLGDFDIDKLQSPKAEIYKIIEFLLKN